jgi:hypothetical protein
MECAYGGAVNSPDFSIDSPKDFSMKFSLNTLFVAPLLVWGLAGCNSATTTTTETTNKDSVASAAATTTDVGHEGTYVDYSDDWMAFKSAVINKNIDGMKMYMQSDIDPQNILDMMDAEAIADMENTSYQQLKVSDYNGKAVKEWDYQVSGVDEEGNEVGSGLFFYMEEQKEGLKMIGILAAG